MPRIPYRHVMALLLAIACCHHAAAATATERSGAEVFQTYCTECHNTGIAGAPKISDKAAWVPRIAQGRAALDQHALHGIGAMPARGSCSACTDAEIKAAVEFIVSKVR